jgi:hypothetical protein
MEHAFALETLAQPGLDQKIRAPLLQEPGSQPLFDIGAAPVLDDDGVDAGKVKQVRQNQTGGTGTDDANLRAHVPHTMISASSVIVRTRMSG